MPGILKHPRTHADASVLLNQVPISQCACASFKHECQARPRVSCIPPRVRKWMGGVVVKLEKCGGEWRKRDAEIGGIWIQTGGKLTLW